jgi:DNA-binding NarL/FixJ family response regulator
VNPRIEEITGTVLSQSHHNDALRLLVVEDSKRVADRLVELLDQIPRVETIGSVESERDAIASMRRSDPDVVILDLHLKQGTGFGVLRSLPTNGDRPTVVVLTNFDLPEYRAQAHALGVTYFLDKANEFERIPEILEEIAARRLEEGVHAHVDGARLDS